MRIQQVRRVVTGHDADGRSIVVSDSPATSVLSRESRPGVALTDLWATEDDPEIVDGGDPVARPVALRPPSGGTLLRVIQFDPEDPDTIASIDGAEAFAAMGARDAVVAGGRHPYMHRTDTVDYAVVLHGSITMLLDHDDVELRAGDVVIQNGTSHAWSNRSDRPCLVAFVLIDARAPATG